MNTHISTCRGSSYGLMVAMALMLSWAPGPLKAQPSTRQLSEVRTFPHDSTGVYLNYPTRIRVVDGQVFVLDNNDSQLHAFSAGGDHLHSIGSPGQGPGEFRSPSDFWVDDGTLWVADPNNGRMHRFTTDGKLVKSDTWSTLGSRIAMIGDDIILLQSRSGFHSGNEEDDLLKCFDRSGAELGSFGAWIDMEPGLPFAVSGSFLTVYQQQVFVLSAFYPLLRVYSGSGNLLRTITFDALAESYRDRVPQNYDWDVLIDRNTNIIRTRFLFRSIRVLDSGIYVGLMDDQLRIDHYSHDGSFVGSYTTPAATEDGLYLHDFEIIKTESGLLELYALIRDGYPRIAVYPLAPFRP